MSGKILALEKNTWIQAYHIRNYELGILQKKTPWILSKHINCYYDFKAMGIFNHCMSEKRYFAKSKAMIVQKFRFDKRFLSLDILNFVQWAKNLIDGGWYIMGYYDEYYIPETASYQYRHFRHTMLIYGYDDESQLFYAMGYTSDRKYRSHCLTYDEFISSIGVDFDRKTEPYVKRDIEKIEFDAFRLNPDCDFTFDLSQVYTSLLDYINCEDSGYRHQRGLKYGFDCEREFVNYIKTQKGKYLDERYSRLFMELKELMVRRLEYLTGEQILSQDVLSEYKKICEQQKNIHLLFIKYNLTMDEKIIDRLADKMSSIIESEKNILPRITDEIYACLVKKHSEEYL